MSADVKRGFFIALGVIVALTLVGWVLKIV